MVCNMPRRHQWSGCRNQWSDEQLQAALEAVRSGKMKAHAATLKFCIPSSTLERQEPKAIWGTPNNPYICRGERDCNILPGFAGVWVALD